MESKAGSGRKFSTVVRRVFRNACFSKEKGQKNGTDSIKTTAVATYYGFERRSVFLVRKGFDLTEPN